MENQRSELAKLGKVLDEKMRSSSNDSHYASKYWVRFNPNDRAPLFWPLLRILLLPVWLPFRLWYGRSKRRDMTDFVVAGTSGVDLDLPNDELLRQLTMEWVKLHPKEFILGEYDPKVAGLQSTFQTIIGEIRRDPSRNSATEHIEG